MQMAKIDCKLDGFARVPPLNSLTISVSEIELMHSAAVVGMPTLASGVPGGRPLLEMLWRMAMVAANLSRNASGDRWVRSAAYNRLDPSEKVAVSYFLGMAQAQLTSRAALGYTHLVHVDRLLLAQGSKLSGKRPDFVAVQVGGRGTPMYGATVEAKGRTNGFDAGALLRAKSQARVVPMISGLAARETIASEAFFDDSNQWSCVLQDPDWSGTVLDIGIEGFLLTYYETVIDAGKQTATWSSDGQVYSFVVPGFPITITIPDRLVIAHTRSSELPARERERAGLLLNALQDLYDETDSLATDWIGVDLNADSEVQGEFLLFEKPADD
jgi:hypothetical protein